MISKPFTFAGIIMEYKKDIERALSNKKSNKKLVQKLKKLPDKKVDQYFHQQHQDVFNEIDCLACANCCKTTSPIFRDIDIRRLAKRLRIKPVDFIEKYLHLDHEKDYVLQQSPCAFLQEDNKCSVYEDRPLACREYPHTNRKKMKQILNLTLKNTEICPAVGRIFDNLNKEI